MTFKYIIILFLALLLPRVSLSQDNDSYRDFVINFSRCNKLNIDGQPYQKNAIVYFEAQKKNGQIALTQVVGEHDKEVDTILMNTFRCMEPSKIDETKYSFVYLIEESLRDHQKMIQVKNNRERRISIFLDEFDLPLNTEVITIGFMKAIR